MSENESEPTETSATGAPEPSSDGQTPLMADGKAAPKVRLRDRLSGLKWLGRTVTHASVLLAVFVLGIALVGLAQRQGWIRSGEIVATSDDAGSNNGETIHTCPMHPQIRQNEPGSCPICGMELVKANGGGGGDGMSVTIEPAARRLIGIQTATAELGPVSQTIRTIGSIDYDESKLATISAYVGGRIEKLYANYVGVPVEKNDDLALIYSPDLYSAQVEYLTATQGSGLKRLGGSANMSELSKQKLIELGLTEDQVSELRSRGEAESRIRVRSPIEGTVIEKQAVEGDYIKTGDKIYRIADLSTVWLMLDLFPDDAARIRFGQQVEAEVSSLPGEVFTGRVAFIDPTVNPTTRTVQVRVEMLNLDARLKPGDYATARVYVPAIRQDRIYDPALADKYISPMHPQVIRETPGDCPICGMALIPTSKLGYASKPIPEKRVVTVPRDSVLMTGENSVIYIESDPGRFEIRRVTVGPMTDDRAVILKGLSAGEVVATHGNFLIDSQMQLAGNPSLMDPSKAAIYPPGPLVLPESKPMVMVGENAKSLDRAYDAYFAIQQALAADQNPKATDVDALEQSLSRLSQSVDVPDAALSDLQDAKRTIPRFSGTLDESRQAFRTLSHALLHAATIVRGERTANRLVHMYCPMVPGGGGDWMQAEGELINPYWGSEMLSCGEVVRDMAMKTSQDSKVR